MQKKSGSAWRIPKNVGPHGFHGFEKLGLQEFFKHKKTKKKTWKQKEEKSEDSDLFLVLFGEVFCCLFSGFESLNFYKLTAEISPKNLTSNLN